MMLYGGNFWFNNGQSNQITIYPDDGLLARYTLIYNNEESNVSLNGTSYTLGYSSSTPQNITSIYIFTCNRSTVNENASVIIYYFKVYSKSEEKYILELYPCIKNETNEVGMCDVLTNDFYQNIGTGDFIYS